MSDGATLVVQIPGLPEPMPAVVDGRDLSSVAAWEAWGLTVLRHRLARIEATRRDPAERRRERERCRRSRDYFACTWAWIFDPMDPANPNKPWIPTPRQVDLWHTMDACMAHPFGPKASLVCSKSREVGASWAVVLDELHRWLFHPGWQARLVSRLEDLVDDSGNPDSLFWKLDYLLFGNGDAPGLPGFLVPRGFLRHRHRNRLKLVNPETGAAVIGESTGANTGHGGRANRRDYDEAPRIPSFRTFWDAGANAAHHQIGLGTENLESIGKDFEDLQTGAAGGTPPVFFPFEWFQVPWHGWDWYRAKKDEMSTAEFACQVERNRYAALEESAVYALSRQITPASGRLGAYPFVAGWPTTTTIDDGHGDDTAILWWQEDKRHGRVRLVEAWFKRRRLARFVGSILKGTPLSDYADLYDRDDDEVMAWVREWMPWRGLTYGDRHGRQENQVTGTSPYHEIEKEFGLRIIDSHSTMTTQDRRDAFDKLLPLIDVNDTPRTRVVVEMWQRHRYRDDTNRVGEQKEPAHDETSHVTWAAELEAVVRTYATMPPKTPGKRHTTGGQTRNHLGARRRGAPERSSLWLD